MLFRFTPSDDQCEDEDISPEDIDLDRLVAGLSAAEVEEVLGMPLNKFKSMMREVPIKKLETPIELERTGRVGAVSCFCCVTSVAAALCYFVIRFRSSNLCYLQKMFFFGTCK